MNDGVENKNKGYSMIGLLAALIIIGVLLLIAVPRVSTLMKGFRDNYYKELEKILESSAQDFYNDNKIYRPDGELKSSYTSINSLIKKKYVEKLVDYKSKTCSLKETDSYVIVIYKGNGKYEYKACISCPDDDYNSNRDKTYCDPAWLNNNNIYYILNESKNPIYVYYDSGKEEIRKKLLKGIKIEKENGEGKILETIEIPNNEKGILPIDIDKIDTRIELDEENKKEQKLRYQVENETKEVKIVVYRHKAPKVTVKRIDRRSYEDGDWTNGVKVTLEKNDEWFERSGTKIANYQMRLNKGEWKNINCDHQGEKECTFTIKKNIEGNYIFRLISSEQKTSEETREYNIKIDIEAPSVRIEPNGGMVQAGQGKGGTILLDLIPKDSGGSGVIEVEYAFSESNQNVPKEWITEQYQNRKIRIRKHLENGKGRQYVWVRVSDRAGNQSTAGSSKLYQFIYEIRYKLEDDKDYKVEYKKDGEEYRIMSNYPSKKNYEFIGWTQTKGSQTVEYRSKEIYNKEEPIILYPVYEKTNVIVTLDRNPPGGKIEFCENNPNLNDCKEVKNIKRGASINLPYVRLTDSDYEFVGWYDEKEGGTRIGGAGDYEIKENVTLYAHWMMVKCIPVTTEWGNTKKASELKFSIYTTDDGPEIYYKNILKNQFVLALRSIGKRGGVTIRPEQYETSYYGYGQALGYKSKEKTCYSKYDNLKPYTPTVNKIGEYQNSSYISDTCRGKDEKSKETIFCNITVRHINKNEEAIFKYWVSSTDQNSNEKSGMSGVIQLIYQYEYSDKVGCEFIDTWSDVENQWVRNQECDCHFKKATITAKDRAGNISEPLIVNIIWK